jgi:hypothetical protein
VRNVEDARLDKQFGVIKSTVELIAKMVDVYVEKFEHYIKYAWAKAIEQVDLSAIDTEH